MKDQYIPDAKSTIFNIWMEKNLYGWAMIQKLPVHGFAWKKVNDFTPEKIDKLVKECKKGYNLQVDVEYPKELHKNYNEQLFLAEE